MTAPNVSPLREARPIRDASTVVLLPDDTERAQPS